MSLTRWTLVSVLLILNGIWLACAECNNGDYAPDPHDCNAFLQCQFQRWVRRNCPRDLHFNRVNFVCDFPWNANCELSESTTTSTTTTPPTGSPPTDPTTTTTTTTSTTTTQPPTTTTHPPTTTTQPPTTTTQPPTTTTQPPITTTSPPITTTSPPITTTSPPITTTSPPITTTSPPITTTSPPFTTTTSSPSPTITTTTLLPTFPPALECAPNDGPYVQHLPHPNCTMFYKCVHGIPHEMLCPFAQHWAIALDRCDSPSEANCIDGAAREQLDARPPNYW